jgi:putative sterol carrier protein
MTNRKQAFRHFAAAIIFSALGLKAQGAVSPEADNSTPQQVFDGMRENFHAEKAKGVHLRYQFQLSGRQGGDWWIEVKDGKCKVDKGKIDKADVTFIASDKDWVALSNGKLKGWWAFLTGRLKIQGEQALARRLDELFN